MTEKNSNKNDTKKAKIGKVYKITDGKLTYYGSTCNPYLSQRYGIHKCMYNAGTLKSSSSKIFKANEHNNFKDIKIKLLYKMEIKNNDDLIELKKKENEYIKNNDCVNIRPAYITREEALKRMRDNFNKRYRENKEYRDEKKQKRKDRYKNDPEFRKRMNEYSRNYSREKRKIKMNKDDFVGLDNILEPIEK